MKGIAIFMDKDKNILKETSGLKLPIKKDIIIKKSIEMFKEDDPCIIYSTMIINKIGMEIVEKIKEKNMEGVMLERESFSSIAGDVLNFDKNTHYLMFV